MFKPLNTSTSAQIALRKTLLYAYHGFGKTTQAKYFKEAYGPGFILSGEAGLSSIASAGIDYLPFHSFDGGSDPATGRYSFVDLCRYIRSDEFKKAGYKWVMLDSLTELSDLIDAWSKARAEAVAVETGKKPDGFKIYADYVDRMIGACKFIRDLPYHVIVSALAKEVENDDGSKEIWPNVNYAKVQQQLPGVFDNVLCGVIVPPKGEERDPRRFIVTGRYAGWQGKVRDEHKATKLVEETASVVDVLRKIEAAEKEVVKKC